MTIGTGTHERAVQSVVLRFPYVPCMWSSFPRWRSRDRPLHDILVVDPKSPPLCPPTQNIYLGPRLFCMRSFLLLFLLLIYSLPCRWSPSIPFNLGLVALFQRRDVCVCVCLCMCVYVFVCAEFAWFLVFVVSFCNCVLCVCKGCVRVVFGCAILQCFACAHFILFVHFLKLVQRVWVIWKFWHQCNTTLINDFL